MNANGAALKKKQLWTLEAFGDENADAVCLRSHLDKFLSVDQVQYFERNEVELPPPSRITTTPAAATTYFFIRFFSFIRV